MGVSEELILVTGATGYIGGRLVPLLLKQGHQVRVLVRSTNKLKGAPWYNDVEIIEGDITNPHTMHQATQKISTLYYLVHSMSSGKNFTNIETLAAKTVAEATTKNQVERIIFLSGLHPNNVKLSRHLNSRNQVGKILLSCPTPTIILQAGVIIGSGSASFEMVRHLTEVLPVMVTPRWVKNHIETIAIRDALYYLIEALTLPKTLNRAFDIGSGEIISYADMMQGYAEVAQLKHRLVLSLPVLTPRLASRWVSAVTPIPWFMARPLVESLQHDTVTKENDIKKYITDPPNGFTNYQTAVKLALRKIRSGEVETTWANASQIAQPGDPLPSDPEWARKLAYFDKQVIQSTISKDKIWEIIEGIGGENGWYSSQISWLVRGWLDRVVGGFGLRRGRRNSKQLLIGDPVDFWRVEYVEKGKILRLKAEMILPGQAWLEFFVTSETYGTCYQQKAIFFPKGLFGRLYWFCLVPFHRLIFPVMAKNIVAAAKNK